MVWRTTGRPEEPSVSLRARDSSGGSCLHVFKAVSEDTNGAFVLTELTANPDFGPPPHIHHREDEAYPSSEVKAMSWYRSRRRTPTPKPEAERRSHV